MNIYNKNEVGEWVQSLIHSGNVHKFYISSQWLKVRAEVLKDFKGECQICKSKGFYKRADTVHHVNYLRKYPHLALSKTYEYQGKEYKNLIPVCDACHRIIHNYNKKKREVISPERWD